MMSDKKVAVFPGSFNPIHAGHIAVIEQAIEVYDKLIILIADNPEKKPQVTPANRKKLISDYLADFGGTLFNAHEITVEYTSMPLAEYCRKNEIQFIVRGIRNGADLEYEETQKYFVTAMNISLTYTFFTVPPEYRLISSTAIREFALLATPAQFFVAYWANTRALYQNLAQEVYHMYRPKATGKK